MDVNGVRRNIERGHSDPMAGDLWEFQKTEERPVCKSQRILTGRFHLHKILEDANYIDSGCPGWEMGQRGEITTGD